MENACYPTLYRRRYIPDEKVCLRNDTIVYYDRHILITEWSTLKPRRDFDRGTSCYLIDKGVKISKFFQGERLLYHYIDILETHIDHEANEIVFNDLLIDVVVENGGLVKVLDLDQVPFALEQGLITCDQAMSALRISAWILDVIYRGDFDDLLKYFDRST
ncbi:MAG: DUF402 domain-containing protein [Defluviitaleaceae bacterium]|nr:DUF402 domain-containing protein [Defluviitaleaceae bacterium]